MNRVKHTDGRVSFRCPGCHHHHTLPVGDVSEGPRWGFNGDLERPTITPSILARGGCYADPTCCQGEDAEYCDRDKPADADGMKVCQLCHSFVTEGRIQFLDDCTHDLRGQTVDLPDLEA